jgi:thioredoxin 1
MICQQTCSFFISCLFYPKTIILLQIIKIMGNKTVEITDANFQDIINSDKPVLVDFWAEWCGPCLMLGPTVEELAEEMEGKAVVGKLNVDLNPNVTNQFGIRSIPTLMVFKNGKMVNKQIGVVPKDTLAKMLEV